MKDEQESKAPANPMKRMVILLSAVPTWIFVCIVIFVFKPFLKKGDPLKYERYSLSEWQEGRTALCKQFDSVFWCCLPFWITVLLAI